jgi:siroheme synthase
MMPMSNLTEVAAVLARAVGGSRPAAVISNATLANQQSISGPLERIARLADQAAIGTPATLVVGDVVAAAPALSVLPNSSVDGGFG